MNIIQTHYYMQAALKYVPFPIRFFKHRHTTLNSDVMRISASPLHLKTVTSQERKKNIWVPNVDSSELVCIYPDKKKMYFLRKDQ